MDCTILILNKKLLSRFPIINLGDGVSIEISTGYRTKTVVEDWQMKRITVGYVEYKLFVCSGSEKYYEEFTTLKDLKEYVYKITDTLTVNQLTKLWGQDGGSELRVE